MLKRGVVVIIAALVAMCACNSLVMAAEDVSTLVKNADEAVAKVESLTSGNVGGFSLGQKIPNLGDVGIISALKGYEQYIAQAFSMIQSLKSKGSNVTDSVNLLKASGQKNLGILQGLQKKTNLSQGVKEAIGAAITKVTQTQKDLQALK